MYSLKWLHVVKIFAHFEKLLLTVWSSKQAQHPGTMYSNAHMWMQILTMLSSSEEVGLVLVTGPPELWPCCILHYRQISFTLP